MTNTNKNSSPDELVERLNSLADCDARSGEPLGKCMRAAAARIQSDASRLATAIEALEGIVQGDEPRPIGKSWRADGVPSKNDKCVHDVWLYETCSQCVGHFASTALASIKGSES